MIFIAQEVKPEFESLEYLIVVDDDTLEGRYSVLDIQNRKFEQLVISSFRYDGKRIATRKDPVRPGFKNRTFSLTNGEFSNGHHSEKWIFKSPKYRNWSTCYGSLNWQRVDYNQPDSITISDFRWKYTMTPDRSYIRVQIGYQNPVIYFECVDGMCNTRTDNQQTREGIALEEMEIIRHNQPWILRSKPRGKE